MRDSLTDITLKDGQVSINGNPLYEPHAQGKTVGLTSTSLGNTQYFVLGDQREAQRDSRQFGAIEEEKIVGRVAFNFSEWLKGQ